MPVLSDGLPLAPGSREDQDLGAEGLLLDLWGVPLHTTVEVTAELTQAGFVETRVDETPLVHLVRGRQPRS